MDTRSDGVVNATHNFRHIKHAGLAGVERRINVYKLRQTFSELSGQLLLRGWVDSGNEHPVERRLVYRNRPLAVPGQLDRPMGSRKS